MKLLRLRDELASEFAPGEAIPVFNQRPAAMGLTISFTVRYHSQSRWPM
jgi:hypothetical protein